MSRRARCQGECERPGREECAPTGRCASPSQKIPLSQAVRHCSLTHYHTRSFLTSDRIALHVESAIRRRADGRGNFVEGTSGGGCMKSRSCTTRQCRRLTSEKRGGAGWARQVILQGGIGSRPPSSHTLYALPSHAGDDVTRMGTFLSAKWALPSQSAHTRQSISGRWLQH